MRLNTIDIGKVILVLVLTLSGTAVSQQPGDFELPHPTFPLQRLAVNGTVDQNPERERFEALLSFTLEEGTNGLDPENEGSAYRWYAGPLNEPDAPRITLVLRDGCFAPVNINQFEVPGIKEFLTCGGRVWAVDFPNKVPTDLTPSFIQISVSLTAIDIFDQAPTQWKLKITGTRKKAGNTATLGSLLGGSLGTTLQIGDHGGDAFARRMTFGHRSAVGGQ